MKNSIILVMAVFMSGCASTKLCRSFSKEAFEKGRSQGSQGTAEDFRGALTDAGKMINTCVQQLMDCQSDLQQKTEILENQK